MMFTRTILPGIILLLLLLGGGVPAMAAGTQTPLTFNANQHAAPALDGDWVAWEEFDYSLNTIHVYNIATGTEYILPHANDFSHAPFIGGNRIVWYEENATGFNDLYWSELPPGPATYVPTPDSFKAYPVISGNKIVWQDNALGFDKVLMYDISNGRIYDLAPDAPPDTSQQFPRIYGDLVVWQDYRNYADADIWMNNTDPASWEQEQLVLDPANQSYNQEMPVIYQDTIVYHDDRAGTRDIYWYDIVAGTGSGNISPDDDGLDQLFPEISHDRISWTDPSGMPPEESRIALFNLTTGTEYPPPITDAQRPELPVRISGNRIVWSETREGAQQVYLYTEGVLRECPVADFTADPVSGSPGLQVNFTDRSVVPADNPVTRHFWDFGDTHTSFLQNPVNTFDLAGSYPVSLTVSNPLCRNTTPMEERYNITIGPPTARFTVEPRTGLIPLTVVVSDTSTGEPDTWNWSFGDGIYAGSRNATHTYTTSGTFDIRLNVSNSYGTSSANATIVAMKGMDDTAFTAISGLSFHNVGGKQRVFLDYSILTNWTFLPNTSVLEFTPPSDRGWGNITIYSQDGTGFTRDPGTHTIHGYVTGVVLRSREMLLDSLSPEIGPQSTFRYHLYHTRYPAAATLNTQVWQGMTAKDLLHFTDIASHTGYGHLSGTAYTVKITKKNIPADVTAVLYMSANASWIEYLALWKTRTAVPRYTDDEVTGEMLPAVFLFHDPVKNLDFFEVTSPHGLSTFGLSQTTGSGNPLQLITLSVTTHVSEPSQVTESSDSGTGSGSGTGAAQVVVPATATATPAPTLTPPDPGRSAKVYTNAEGVVTQAARLPSTDGRALITIGEGVVAKDAGGTSLAEITLKALAPENLPAVPPGSSFTFAGMAYEIGPDGAIFSPPASLTFTLPQAQWGQDYSIKSFDRKSGIWQDLPTTFNATTGIVTAQVSHLSVFALFTQPRAALSSPVATPLPVPSAPLVKAQPPATAVSMFTGMLTWGADLVMHNAILLGVIIILATALYFAKQGRFPGSGR